VRPVLVIRSTHVTRRGRTLPLGTYDFFFGPAENRRTGPASAARRSIVIPVRRALWIEHEPLAVEQLPKQLSGDGGVLASSPFHVDELQGLAAQGLNRPALMKEDIRMALRDLGEIGPELLDPGG
jgi:hypothetical protein